MCCEKIAEACTAAAPGRVPAGSLRRERAPGLPGVLMLPRASNRYRSVADEQAALRMRIRDLAQARVSYGYRRLQVFLQREGWGVNHKRVYRLYSQEGLMLRTKKPKRHVSCQRRMERPVAAGMDESWFMDFMSDELFDGRRIRLLTIVDNLTRESLAIPTLTCQSRPASGDTRSWRFCSG